MKKIILFLVFSFGYTNGYSRHDYDNQSILYSNNNTVSIGATPQGNYGATERALEIKSSTGSFFSLVQELIIVFGL